MKIIHYANGEDEARDHPWVPGGAFISNPHLEPLLKALEESGIETAEELTSRLKSDTSELQGLEAARRAAGYHIGDPSWGDVILAAYRNPDLEPDDLDDYLAAHDPEWFQDGRSDAGEGLLP